MLGIATPEFLEGEGSTRIVEGWVVITGQGEGVEEVVTGAPLSGVITHEFGHAIGLAHSQTNGLYFRNQPIEAWGLPAGAERAGPDQCPAKRHDLSDGGAGRDDVPVHRSVPDEPDLQQPRHGDGQCRRRHVGALLALSGSRIPPGAPAASPGRVLAQDGASALTGINVIARNAAQPFDAISRISGDRTQGLVGRGRHFEIAGLTPGAQYVLYIDQLGAGGFSTPKAILLGPRGDTGTPTRAATRRSTIACAATQIVARRRRDANVRIAMNGIDARTGLHVPAVLPAH